MPHNPFTDEYVYNNVSQDPINIRDYFSRSLKLYRQQINIHDTCISSKTVTQFATKRRYISGLINVLFQYK